MEVLTESGGGVGTDEHGETIGREVLAEVHVGESIEELKRVARKKNDARLMAAGLARGLACDMGEEPRGIYALEVESRGNIARQGKRSRFGLTAVIGEARGGPGIHAGSGPREELAIACSKPFLLGQAREPLL
jgi:hypothetical protein